MKYYKGQSVKVHPWWSNDWVDATVAEVEFFPPLTALKGGNKILYFDAFDEADLKRNERIRIGITFDVPPPKKISQPPNPSYYEVGELKFCTTVQNP